MTTPENALKAAQKLVDLIGWLRDKLERLEKNVVDWDVRVTLNDLIRAADPATNPRLKQVVDDLELLELARTWRTDDDG